MRTGPAALAARPRSLAHRVFPVLPVAGAVGALALVLLVSGQVTAADLRRVTGHDLEHARLLGPFATLRR